MHEILNLVTLQLRKVFRNDVMNDRRYGFVCLECIYDLIKICIIGVARLDALPILKLSRRHQHQRNGMLASITNGACALCLKCSIGFQGDLREIVVSPVNSGDNTAIGHFYDIFHASLISLAPSD